MAKSPNKFVYLHDVYHNPHSGAAYARLPLLYKFVKKDKKHFFTRYKIAQWLKTQSTYTEHKPPVREKRHGRVFSGKSRYLYDTDIGVFNSPNVKTNKFLLTVDTFDRRVHVEPVSSLKWPKIKVALQKTFAKLGKPERLRSDFGSEFISAPFKAYVKSRNVRQFYANPPQKAGYAERLIRSIKAILARVIENSSKTSSWLTALPKALAIYHSRFHRSLNKFESTTTL